ncbi:MAG: hypothetical protein ACUVR4_01630 [Anaerolineae bacterium]
MMPQVGRITHFKGTLPPANPDKPFVLPPHRNTPGGVILRALHPLRGELDALLARDDRQAALRLAYHALAQVADTLAAYRGDKLRPGQVRIHALLVELKPLPLEPQPDGTLIERGTAVSVSYQNWAVAHSQAYLFAQALTERFHALWPGAWVVVSAGAAPFESIDTGNGR